MKEAIEEVNERRKQELERIHSIRFRAWDNKDKKMIPWTEIKKDKWMLWDMLNGNGHPISPHRVFYVPMQYTGLKDKNGVEIYEGDILKCLTHTNGFEIYLVEYCESEGRFALTEYGGSPETSYRKSNQYNGYPFGFHGSNPWYSNRQEIIGNIHENPELLEGVK